LRGDELKKGVWLISMLARKFEYEGRHNLPLQLSAKIQYQHSKNK